MGTIWNITFNLSFKIQALLVKKNIWASSKNFAILVFNKVRKTTRLTNHKSGIDDGEMSSHDLDNAPER
jgi:hypothetical protein